MSEFLGWLTIAGLAAAIASIFMLGNQLRQHMRDTTEMMVRNNELLLSRLDQLTDPSPTPPEPTLGILLEERPVNRRDPLRPAGSKTNLNPLPRRRLEDVLTT